MKIHHIGYCVKSMDKAAKDFKKLGFIEETAVIYDSLRNMNILFMVQEQWRIELIQPAGVQGEKCQVDDLLKRNHGGSAPYHICYETDHIEEEIERLKTEHFILVEAPQEAAAMGEATVAFLYKPGSGLMELVERKRDV